MADARLTQMAQAGRRLFCSEITEKVKQAMAGTCTPEAVAEFAADRLEGMSQKIF